MTQQEAKNIFFKTIINVDVSECIFDLFRHSALRDLKNFLESYIWCPGWATDDPAMGGSSTLYGFVIDFKARWVLLKGLVWI